MPRVKKKTTIDDVIGFIEANAPTEDTVLLKSPFKGRKFPYELVEKAIDYLHGRGRFLDLEAYDISGTMNMWHLEEGMTNYELARKATKQLIRRLQEQESEKHLDEIITNVTENKFHKTPINRYGTTLGGMLKVVYQNSPHQAVKDLIDNDDEFAEFRDLEPYDMHQSSQNTWVDLDGTKNYELARKATKQLIRRLQEKEPQKPLSQTVTGTTRNNFKKTPINKYGTTLEGMLICVYGGSPYQALKDLIDNDDEFAEFRDLEPYDMPQSPQNTWVNPDYTKNYKLARKATKRLVNKLQELYPAKPLEEVVASITKQDFIKIRINRYGTTLGGMLKVVYQNSPHQAVKDLVDSDPEFQGLRVHF